MRVFKITGVIEFEIMVDAPDEATAQKATTYWLGVRVPRGEQAEDSYAKEEGFDMVTFDIMDENLVVDEVELEDED